MLGNNYILTLVSIKRTEADFVQCLKGISVTRYYDTGVIVMGLIVG